jgi:hypothetical protein
VDAKRVWAEFKVDGSLRAISIRGTTLADWQRMLDALWVSAYHLEFRREGELQTPPHNAAEPFEVRREAVAWLSVTSGGVTANCHFFTEEEIEFDIDPREVKGKPELDCALGFLRWLANAVGREAIMTWEGYRDHPVFTARPGCDRIEWHA